MQEKINNSIPDDAVNILRGRTFNEDLRGLVHRIKGNEESDSVLLHEDFLGAETMAEDELVRNFHRLFYLIKNLDEIGGVNAEFNPFMLLKNAGADSPDEILIQHIAGLLETISVRFFAILYFSFELKCYVPLVGRFGGVKIENFTISTEENFFSELLKKSNGVIIEKDTIENDLFFNKRFFSAGIRGHLYFNFLNRITDHIRCDISHGNTAGNPNLFTSPLIILQYDSDLSDGLNERITDFLKRHCALPFLFYNKNIFIGVNDRSYEDINIKLIILDFIFGIFNRSHGKTAIILRSGRSHDKKTFFIKKFIKSKIERNLPPGSVLIDITETVILILSDPENLETIQNLTREYAAVTKDQIESEIIKPGDFKNIHSLLNTCV